MKKILFLIICNFFAINVSMANDFKSNILEKVNVKLNTVYVETDIKDAVNGNPKDLILSLDYEDFVYFLFDFITKNKLKNTFGLIDFEIKNNIKKEFPHKSLKYLLSNRNKTNENAKVVILSKEEFLNFKPEEKLIFQNAIIMKGKIIKKNQEFFFDVIFNDKIININIDWDLILEDEIKKIVDVFNMETSFQYSK